MRVLKFGGSSVANATNISRVLDIVCQEAEQDRVILVSSAIKGCTDELLKNGLTESLKEQHRQIARRLFTGSERNQANSALDAIFNEIEQTRPEVIEAYGEILSTTILNLKLSCDGVPSLWLDSRTLIRKGADGKVDQEKSYSAIREAVQAHPEVRVFVAPGFIASDWQGRTCTLGRGGSDYSAALFAAGAAAESLEIWTDVPGMMTTNPKDVPAARTIPSISFTAARQLAERGAKVLYAPTIEPAMSAGIPFRILNTFSPGGESTLVSALPEGETVQWRGVAKLDDDEFSTVHLVGEGPVNGKATLSRILSALKENGIRVLGSGAQEDDHVLFVKVHHSESKAAVSALHREFFEQRRYTNIRIFIAGAGSVGKALLGILEKGRDEIARRTGTSITVCGISDSRHFVVCKEGVGLADLPGGKEVRGWNYIEAVKACAHRGSVFVDCTNSETVGREYTGLLEAGISVVSSNRRAISGPYSQYAEIKAAAAENGVMFKYDTTVGTALPILESISDSANSCDRIISIEAVVSCTMNQILSAYDIQPGTLADLLRQAQESGLTEKDPRFDLAGKDALRKLLILGREAGIPLEAEDVEVIPMLSEDFFTGSLEEFYEKLQAAEPEFAAREDEMDLLGKRQRFVASIFRDEGCALGYKASIRMQAVGEDSPFFYVKGSENVTAVRSDYIESPLILKGAGEGPKLAASGIINDILKGYIG